ncbi:stage II sporulation protein D [Clostridium sp. YIM B02515]|uniref:Stage II sporulation protein D n=1 Tax=Clostridium rhizosphaerae TaxID=2803861 RepID=A0ABS1T8X0_9CLOT|nr:stage II sporulation protein D [Clostridium rhizosphaerae]MBL4935784.1 stage II sporulation protein D [Clostridium rhizosphaerae]
MQRVNVSIQLKKMVLAIIGSMIIMILLAVIIVGIGSKSGSIINSKGIINKFNLNNNNIVLKNVKGETNIKVFLTEQDKVVDMSLEDYVRGVVSGEMPAEFDIEALKAQAVAARTYALSHMEKLGGSTCTISKDKGADICDTVHCQVYKTKEGRFNDWPKKNAEEYWAKITEAVKQTAGEVITYDGSIIKSPYYFSMSSGRTENAADVFSMDVPYLKSVDSSQDKSLKDFQTIKKYTYNELANIINSKYPKAGVTSKKLSSQMIIKETTSGGGSVKKIALGSIVITGPQYREMLNLKSSNFTFKFNSKDVEIITKGYGHDVGMSQYGAGAMAKGGSNYKQILTHYYQGVKIEKIDDIK